MSDIVLVDAVSSAPTMIKLYTFKLHRGQRALAGALFSFRELLYVCVCWADEGIYQGFITDCLLSLTPLLDLGDQIGRRRERENPP